MASWAEGRGESSKGRDAAIRKQKKDALERVNDVLGALHRDDVMQDNLAHEDVRRAMRHWTAEERLPAEEAAKLEDNYRVQAVFERLSVLQAACREAGIPVPLNALMTGKQLNVDALLRDDPADRVHTKSSGKKGNKDKDNERGKADDSAPLLAAGDVDDADGGCGVAGAPPGGMGPRSAEPGWSSLLQTEALKAIGVAVCALLFSAFMRWWHRDGAGVS